MKNLKEISTRLKIAKKNIEKIDQKKSGSNAASLGKALKISTELVAAVAVGTTIGFLLDSWFDTKPLLIICFFFAVLRYTQPRRQSRPTVRVLDKIDFS